MRHNSLCTNRSILSPTIYRLCSNKHGHQCNPYAEFLSISIITGLTNLLVPTSSYTATPCELGRFLILLALHTWINMTTRTPVKKHITHVTETDMPTVVATDKSNDSVLVAAVTDGCMDEKHVYINIQDLFFTLIQK